MFLRKKRKERSENIPPAKKKKPSQAKRVALSRSQSISFSLFRVCERSTFAMIISCAIFCLFASVYKRLIIVERDEAELSLGKNGM